MKKLISLIIALIIAVPQETGLLPSTLYPLPSVLCPLSSVLCPKSHALRPPAIAVHIPKASSAGKGTREIGILDSATGKFTGEAKELIEKYAPVAKASESIKPLAQWQQRLCSVSYTCLPKKVLLQDNSYNNLIKAKGAASSEEELKQFAEFLQESLKEEYETRFGIPYAKIKNSEMFFHYIKLENEEFAKKYPVEAFFMGAILLKECLDTDATVLLQEIPIKAITSEDSVIFEFLLTSLKNPINRENWKKQGGRGLRPAVFALDIIEIFLGVHNSGFRNFFNNSEAFLKLHEIELADELFNMINPESVSAGNSKTAEYYRNIESSLESIDRSLASVFGPDRELKHEQKGNPQEIPQLKMTKAGDLARIEKIILMPQALMEYLRRCPNKDLRALFIKGIRERIIPRYEKLIDNMPSIRDEEMLLTIQKIRIGLTDLSNFCDDIEKNGFELPVAIEKDTEKEEAETVNNSFSLEASIDMDKLEKECKAKMSDLSRLYFKNPDDPDSINKVRRQAEKIVDRLQEQLGQVKGEKDLSVQVENLIDKFQRFLRGITPVQKTPAAPKASSAGRCTTQPEGFGYDARQEPPHLMWKFLCVMGVRSFALFRQFFSNPHTNKSKIPDSLLRGNFFKGFYHRVVHTQGDEALARFGELNIPRFFKFLLKLSDRVSLPELSFFSRRLKFRDVLGSFHILLPPLVSPAFSLVHISGSDYSGNSASFNFKNDHQVTTAVSLTKRVTALPFASQDKRTVKTGFFNLIGRNAVSGNMPDIYFVPFKGNDSQNQPPFDTKSIHVYTKDVKKNFTSASTPALPKASSAGEDNIRKFGKTGLEFFVLGAGTIWFGRKWPMDSPSYAYPDSNEIKNYLDRIFTLIPDRDGMVRMVMIDTAAAYGLSEEKIGEYFNARKEKLSKAFIATKWGEEFDISKDSSTVDHSKEHLIASVGRSLSRLGKIDLLYIHATTLEVLRDREIIAEMKRMKKVHYGGIHFIGASISQEKVLEKAIEEDLLWELDAIQMPAWLFLKKGDLVDKIYEKGIAIVLNSPVRNKRGQPPKDVYTELLSRKEIAVILFGSRHHLEETVGYVLPDNSKACLEIPATPKVSPSRINSPAAAYTQGRGEAGFSAGDLEILKVIKQLAGRGETRIYPGNEVFKGFGAARVMKTCNRLGLTYAYHNAYRSNGNYEQQRYFKNEFPKRLQEKIDRIITRILEKDPNYLQNKVVEHIFSILTEAITGAKDSVFIVDPFCRKHLFDKNIGLINLLKTKLGLVVKESDLRQFILKLPRIGTLEDKALKERVAVLWLQHQKRNGTETISSFTIAYKFALPIRKAKELMQQEGIADSAPNTNLPALPKASSGGEVINLTAIDWPQEPVSRGSLIEDTMELLMHLKEILRIAENLNNKEVFVKDIILEHDEYGNITEEVKAARRIYFADWLIHDMAMEPDENGKVENGLSSLHLALNLRMRLNEGLKISPAAEKAQDNNHLQQYLERINSAFPIIKAFSHFDPARIHEIHSFGTKKNPLEYCEIGNYFGELLFNSDQEQRNHFVLQEAVRRMEPALEKINKNMAKILIMPPASTRAKASSTGRIRLEQKPLEELLTGLHERNITCIQDAIGPRAKRLPPPAEAIDSAA